MIILGSKIFFGVIYMARLDVNVTPTAYAILGLLRERPMHGYEIANTSNRKDLGQVVPADMSNDHTFLKDLQEHGLIHGERLPWGPPPAQVFGWQTDAFLEWLRRPVAHVKCGSTSARHLPNSSALLKRSVVKAQGSACRDYLERQKPTRDIDPMSFESLVLSQKSQRQKACWSGSTGSLPGGCHRRKRRCQQQKKKTQNRARKINNKEVNNDRNHNAVDATSVLFGYF
jgi:hypothetical protein